MRALAFVVLTGCAGTSHSTTQQRPFAMPPVELQALDGQTRSLAAELAGRPALVSLWATWCDTCMTELGPLARLSTKAAEKGAYVVAVSEGEELTTVAAFVRTKGIAYPQLLDPRFELADALGSRRVPATLVLDRKGQVVYRGAALSEGRATRTRSLDRRKINPR